MKKKKNDKVFRVKLDSETLQSIWNASRPTVSKNKKKYTRKTKHKGR